ncbi:hypothetical protein ACIRPQ_28975 [Streptomyces sp. NPDC101213]|uniref:hypothetical protein n=1 Tax=Streptomyces sp. NPDC101213 TaxID=3366130 RepID=UPI0037FBF89B
MANGRSYARKRTNALHALHNAGLITFVKSEDRPRSEGGRGGKVYTVVIDGKELELQTVEVDAFVAGVVGASGRTDIDLERPFAAAS